MVKNVKNGRGFYPEFFHCPSNPFSRRMAGIFILQFAQFASSLGLTLPLYETSPSSSYFTRLTMYHSSTLVTFLQIPASTTCSEKEDCEYVYMAQTSLLLCNTYRQQAKYISQNRYFDSVCQVCKEISFESYTDQGCTYNVLMPLSKKYPFLSVPLNVATLSRRSSRTGRGGRLI